MALICKDSLLDTTLKCARKCEALWEVNIDNTYNVYLLDYFSIVIILLYCNNKLEKE